MHIMISLGAVIDRSPVDSAVDKRAFLLIASISTKLKVVAIKLSHKT